MRRTRLLSFFAVVLVTAACSRREPGAPAGAAATPVATPAAPAAEAKPVPYTYPAPVKGSIHETNIGRFDLVDGVAYVAGDGAGTVVFASSKPIASPMLAGSPCPMTEARSIEILRNASWAEVTANAKGNSKYFAFGKAFGGSTFDESPGGREFRVYRRPSSPNRIVGTAVHRSYGISSSIFRSPSRRSAKSAR